MEKMKKFKICIASGLAFVSMFGGVFVLAQHTNAENAPEAQTASSLWESVDGITLTDNVDVPDYMKYGKYTTTYAKKGTEPILYEVLTDDQQNLEDWELNGLKMVSTMEGQSISYKHTLDLNNLSSSEDLLTLAAIPSTRGTMDFDGLEIMLQDADDESNYIKISMSNYILWTAGTKVQAETPNVSRMGPNIYLSVFKGLTQDSYNIVGDEIRHRPLKIRYDTSTRTVSVIGSGGERTTIAELANENRVGYGNAWKGFKNNRVKLSITMSNFQATEVQLMILNVCGQGMNGATLKDTTAPKFFFAEDVNAMPKAKVGKKYPLCDVQCTDVVSGPTEYNCTVTSPTGKNVEIVDGCFLPTENGYYKLLYTATDGAGNVAKKEIQVFATNALPPIIVEAESVSGSFAVGENIPVCEATATGGSGTLNITTEVVRVGGGERINAESGMFAPMLGGTYCVIYTATDYLGNIGTKTITYEVARAQTVIMESITELKRIFDGVQVRFPQPIVYDYVTCGGSKLNGKYEIAVYDKQNARTVLEDGVFMPDSEKYGESVKVEYVMYANNDATKENAVTHTYEVPLFAKEGDERRVGRIEDYFIFDRNVFKTEYNPDNESEYLKFYTKQAAEKQSISFANPLLVEGFHMSFVLPAREQNYTSLTISLRDSINSQIGLDLELVDITEGADKDTKTYVYSGGEKYAMNGTGNTVDANTGEEIASKTPLALTYKNGKILDYNKSLVLRPTVGFNGTEFNGFPSGKAYFTFTFNGVTGASSLLISQLCTQMLYVEYDEKGEVRPFVDVIEPTIMLLSDVRNDYQLDEVVTVPAAMGFDLLTPNVDVYVTVQTPSGRKIYDKEPATKDLNFVLDSQGTYRITYEATDGENSSTKPYTIRAKDVLAPTIAVSTTELKGNVGKALTIPKAVLLDNMDQNPRLCIMIVTPRGTIITLGERTEKNAIDSYTFTEKGKYYIRYCAFDSTYNMDFTDIPVVIS